MSSHAVQLLWNVITMAFGVIASMMFMGKLGLPKWAALVPVWGNWKARQRVYGQRKFAVMMTVIEVVFYIMIFAVTIAMFLLRGSDGTLSRQDMKPLMPLLMIAGLVFVALLGIAFGLTIIWCRDVAASFGQDPAFAVLVFLFASIAYLVIGCGDAVYAGPAGDPMLSEEDWRNMPPMPQLSFWGNEGAGYQPPYPSPYPAQYPQQYAQQGYPAYPATYPAAGQSPYQPPYPQQPQQASAYAPNGTPDIMMRSDAGDRNDGIGVL